MSTSKQKRGDGSEAVDIAYQQVAAVYAKALMAAAESKGQTAEMVAEFRDVITELFDAHPRFEAMFTANMIPHEEMEGLLDRVLGGRISPLLLDFFKVVSKHGRLAALRSINAEVQRRYDTLSGRTRVQVTTAVAMDPSGTTRLAEGLRKLLNSEPILEETVEPALIGGVVLRIGDTVYDGSVARQLQQMREQMIDRSVHEIQSRRDRFRSTSGN